ncbi:hypothetical protein E4T47_06254 [Aureobasidium subglaciale]|nr:hypothetical protein E4T47_06254 [Aureobasidium subglaciale]
MAQNLTFLTHQFVTPHPFSIQHNYGLTTMMSLRTSLLRTSRIASTRPLSTTSRLAKDPPPPPNIPPGRQQKGDSKPPAHDAKSSASTKGSDPAATKSGDDHPAKQPDPQKPSDRSTGFQEVHEVKGGKEGLGARTDKQ